MKYLVKPVLLISLLGLFLSLVAHLSALAGIDLKVGDGVLVLHVGIFLVWIPAVLLAMKLGRGKSSAWGFGGTSWKRVLAGCPPWMFFVLIGLFAYAFLNFFLSAKGLRVQRQQGSMASPDVIRGFSGHWLVFYYAAFAIAYSAFKRPELLGNPTCQNGHKVLPTEKFCSECGSPVVLEKTD